MELSLTAAYRFLLGTRLRYGPFAGMDYPSKSIGSALAPKLLGTYELELLPFLQLIRTSSYDVVIDIGAAEGYYAVGLCMLCPSCRVIAFESERSGQTLIQSLADRNDVSKRTTVRGCCRVADLNASLTGAGKSLVMIDAEGAEHELLDPAAVPSLASSDILVEVHEFIVSGITQILRERFQTTHTIQEVASRNRSFNDAPRWFQFLAKVIPGHRLHRSLDEGRPAPMKWMYMVCRQQQAKAAS